MPRKRRQNNKDYASIKSAEKLLRSCQLLEGVEKPDYNCLEISEVRGLSYDEMYLYFFKNRWYDFILSDGALIQFRKTDEDSFYFYPRHEEFPTFREFILEYFPDEAAHLGLDEIVEEYVDLYEEYEEHVSTLGTPTAKLPIRYDRDFKRYEAGVHPAAHFHLGYVGDLRIGVNYLQNPYSFVLFILRQTYPKVWRSLVECDDNVKAFKLALRKDAGLVPSNMRIDKDHCELYLG